MSAARETRRRLTRAFYARDTELVARDLLGAVLESTVRGVRCRGRIVETEAYVGEHDAACHAAAGRTARAIGLWGPPGSAYVYLIYGMYWCVNVVTRAAGLPSAVLLRAVEPLEGIPAMRRRRGAKLPDRELTSGPGKLCVALGITGPRHHGGTFLRGALGIFAGDPIDDGRVLATPRIGINPRNAACQWPLRWVVRDSPYISARAETDRFARRLAG